MSKPRWPRTCHDQTSEHRSAEFIQTEFPIRKIDLETLRLTSGSWLGAKALNLGLARSIKFVDKPQELKKTFTVCHNLANGVLVSPETHHSRPRQMEDAVIQSLWQIEPVRISDHLLFARNHHRWSANDCICFSCYNYNGFAPQATILPLGVVSLQERTAKSSDANWVVCLSSENPSHGAPRVARPSAPRG